MKKVIITCNHCKKDLSSSVHTPKYRLGLYQEFIKVTSDCTRAIHAREHLDDSYHFCDLNCLDKWLEKRRN